MLEETKKHTKEDWEKIIIRVSKPCKDITVHSDEGN